MIDDKWLNSGLSVGLADTMRVYENFGSISNSIDNILVNITQPLRGFENNIGAVMNSYKALTDIGKITTSIAAFSNPITAFTNPVIGVNNHLAFLNSPLYKSPSGFDGLKGVMAWHNSITNFQKDLYPVINTDYLAGVKSVTDSLSYLKDISGLIDFSKHKLISDSFLKVASILNDFAYENDIKFEDEYVESNLNLALNADYENNIIDNSEIPFHVINYYLQIFYKLLLSIKNEGESINNTITFLINKPQKSVFEYALCSIISIIFVHHVEELLFPTNDKTIETNTHVYAPIKIKYDTTLKSEANENSYTICIVPSATILINVPNENNRGWVKIEFIDSNGSYQSGWILNNNLDY